VSETEVFRLTRSFNEAVYKFMREKENPFGMEKHYVYPRGVTFDELNDLADPCISSAHPAGGSRAHSGIIEKTT